MRAVLALAPLRPLGCLCRSGCSVRRLSGRLGYRRACSGGAVAPLVFGAKICTPVKRLYPIRLAYVVDF